MYRFSFIEYSTHSSSSLSRIFLVLSAGSCFVGATGLDNRFFPALIFLCCRLICTLLSNLSATYPNIAFNVSSYRDACIGPMVKTFPFNDGFEPLKISWFVAFLLVPHLSLCPFEDVVDPVVVDGLVTVAISLRDSFVAEYSSLIGLLSMIILCLWGWKGRLLLITQYEKQWMVNENKRIIVIMQWMLFL